MKKTKKQLEQELAQVRRKLNPLYYQVEKLEKERDRLHALIHPLKPQKVFIINFHDTYYRKPTNLNISTKGKDYVDAIENAVYKQNVNTSSDFAIVCKEGCKTKRYFELYFEECFQCGDHVEVTESTASEFREKNSVKYRQKMDELRLKSLFGK